MMYIEWPHIDGAFTQAFATMAGRTPGTGTTAIPSAATRRTKP